jgi:hypothetical protein
VSKSKDLPVNIFKSENIPAHWADLGVVPFQLIENGDVSSIKIQISQFIPVHNNAFGVHCSIRERSHGIWDTQGSTSSCGIGIRIVNSILSFQSEGINCGWDESNRYTICVSIVKICKIRIELSKGRSFN